MASNYSQQINKFLVALQRHYSKDNFDNLYNYSFGHMILIAKIYLSDKNFAEDVVTEAFLRILHSLHKFDPSQNGYNWMCKIAQNVALTYNRKNSRRIEAEKGFVSGKDISCEIDLSQMQFFDSIKGLDETDKLIAYKRFCLDQSVQNIADSLNVSKAAISQRIKKFFKKLDEKLKTG